MNRVVRTILIIAVCLIPVGVVAMLVGFSFGGRTGWRYDFSSRKALTRGEAVSETVELKDFDSLKIDVTSADVIIESGDSYRLEYKVYKGEEPVITEGNGSLTVKQPTTNGFMVNFGYDAGDNIYKITVPGNSKEISLDIKSSSGEITIDSVNSSGKIEASSGDIRLNDIEGAELKVKTSSGEIICNKLTVPDAGFTASSGIVDIMEMSAEDISCHTSSGDIRIKGSTAASVDCEASSGEVTIELKGNEDDYSYDLDASSGDIRVNGQKFDDDYKKDSSGDRMISVKTSSGDIKVTVE